MSSHDSLWYKDAIIYQLHVKAFFDSNEDGLGDFPGLAQKLDYIQQLGANTIWLLPFYPSPLKDDGYDIADYTKVHPRYGTLKDFRAFVQRAHELGLKVITELVINHTSDQHPWFQEARRAAPGSAKREFYVWSESDQKFPETRIIFTDTEASNWAWDPVAKAYYWHRFFSHQPDLNHNNPRVVKAVMRLMRHWLDMGVDGLRLDAIPYLCVREGTNNENLPETHLVIKQLRAELDAHYSDRMLLAEANQWPEDVRHYFGDSDECHMAFHFPVMPRIYMAVAQGDRQPLVDILEQTPEIPPSCQWAMFLRNHDELTLEMVTDREREQMYRVYATDPRMRCNVGIRRRLASLMDNDRRKVELLNSLLLSFPGTPIIYYGDEIGMGDNIYLDDRHGVRTPMQWTMDRNAGFSRADPARLYLPVIMGPVYGHTAVNVEAQERNPSSLLNWMRRIIAVRKEHRTFSRGTLRMLKPRNRHILAYLREYEGETLLCVANLAHHPQPVELELREFAGRRPVELLGDTPFPPLGEQPYLLTLPGYGFYWFRLAPREELVCEEQTARLELPFWVIPQGWETVRAEQRKLEETLLPRFLERQAWCSGQPAALERVELISSLASFEGGQWLLGLARMQLPGGAERRYFLPLAISWDAASDELLEHHPAQVVAKVRQGFRCGVLHDALLEPSFCRLLLATIANGGTLRLGDGELRGRLSGAPASFEPQPAVRPAPAEQSSSAVMLGETLLLTCGREIGVSLPVADPSLVGVLEHVQAGAPTVTLGLLQQLGAGAGNATNFP